MSCPSSPYDILAVISFVQGCLNPIAAGFGALWSVTQQVRVNKTLMDNFFSKITQLQNQHEGSSLVKSGTTRRLFRELEWERMASHPKTIHVAPPLQQWLNQSQTAPDPARISYPPLMADATQAEDFATLAYNVKNLIETWQDSPVSHREARALTKRLEKFSSPDNEDAHFASKLSTVLHLRETISPTAFVRVTPGRESIGSGSFSEVRRGMWNNQTVAVKIFRPLQSRILQSGNGNIIEDSVKTFTREFWVWNTVSGQPKLWPLHGFSISIDVDFEDVRLLLVSPLAAGDLTNISRDNLSNNAQIVTFILDIALGLKNLHNFDIIHGDLRASNVLLFEGHCYLVDFGIAKMPTMTTLATFAKMIHCGWAAPELDQEPRSKQSDIFSFACTIFEMFTRRPPYEVDSSVYDRSKPPMRTGRLKRVEWDELWNVLVDCWSADPLDRPTASELEASLRSILQPLSE